MKARENPFRVERLHELKYRFDQGTLVDLVDRLAEQHWRGAIVGAHGTGKTTLLLELARELEQRGQPTSLIRLSGSDRHVAATKVETWLLRTEPVRILLLDGAEQLRERDWRACANRSQNFAGLVVTTHRPGRLTAVHHTTPHPQLLQQLVEQLTPGQSPMDAPAIDELYRRHRGNIRNCLRELYDRTAEG